MQLCLKINKRPELVFVYNPLSPTIVALLCPDVRPPLEHWNPGRTDSTLHDISGMLQRYHPLCQSCFQPSHIHWEEEKTAQPSWEGWHGFKCDPKDTIEETNLLQTAHSHTGVCQKSLSTLFSWIIYLDPRQKWGRYEPSSGYGSKHLETEPLGGKGRKSAESDRLVWST